jgi:subtilisin family serine protease
LPYILAQNSKFSSHLKSVLRSSEARNNKQLSYNVWVMFTDKGKPTSVLAPKAVSRRIRNGFPIFDHAINDEYISRVLARTNGNLRARSLWMNAISLGGITKQELDLISTLNFVSSLDVVNTFHKQIVPLSTIVKRDEFDYSTSASQLSQLNILKAHQLGLTGENITIGVLDSGFRLTHECFKKIKVIGQYDFVYNDSIVDNQAGQDVSEQYQHGTSVLSLIAGQDDGKVITIIPLFLYNLVLWCCI